MNGFIKFVTAIVTLIVLAVWTVLGLLLWIPFMTRMILVFIGAVVTSIYTHKDPVHAKQGLEMAISFYMRGFETILGKRTNPETGGVQGSEIVLWRLFVEVAFAIVFWVGLTLGWYTFIHTGVVKVTDWTQQPVTTSSTPSEPATPTRTESGWMYWEAGSVPSNQQTRIVTASFLGAGHSLRQIDFNECARVGIREQCYELVGVEPRTVISRTELWNACSKARDYIPVGWKDCPASVPAPTRTESGLRPVYDPPILPYPETQTPTSVRVWTADKLANGDTLVEWSVSECASLGLGRNSCFVVDGQNPVTLISGTEQLKACSKESNYGVRKRWKCP